MAFNPSKEEVDELNRRISFPDEERIDLIGQNGNEGEHYNQVDFENCDVPNVSQPSAYSILMKGIEHMRQRSVTYDSQGERSIGKTVEAFNIITGDGVMDRAERGWLFMVLLKLVRSQQGDFNLDNYEDAAAYCGLMGEAAYKERNYED